MNETRCRRLRLPSFDAAWIFYLQSIASHPQRLVLALVAPHRTVQHLSGDGVYHAGVHEALRLYGCLRLACGWILWHVRSVDDGRFRRHVCEALCCCYVLQAMAVLRAQWTAATVSTINSIASIVLLMLSAAYASFRFDKGGNRIKIYELPTSNMLE